MSKPTLELPRRVYPLRVLGMGLGSAGVAAVLWERNADLTAWIFLALTTWIWPHAAYLLGRLSANPYRTEKYNLLVDSAIVAALVPLMHFNALPSVLLVTLTLVDKISSGIRNLWAWSLPVMAAAAAASAAAVGFHWSPATSMAVLMACLPVMSLHPLAVGVATYRLIRQAARHNRMLDEMRRTDHLTGLYTRGHWQEQAEATLRRHHACNEPACMLMLDMDHFKQINDQHGHTVGDEVLRALARIMLNNIRTTDCAGRFGGDEFCIVLRNTHLDHAIHVAERIREQVQAMRVRGAPDLRMSTSIGIAAADHQYANLRAWANAADTELYQAKTEGRNRVAARPPAILTPLV